MNDPTKPRMGANPPPLPLPPGAPVALCHLSHVGQLDLLGVKRIGLHPEDAKALAELPKGLEEASGLLILPHVLPRPLAWEVVPNAAITRGHVVFDPPARIKVEG